MINVNDNKADDKLLLLHMQQGSSSAFDALYDKYWEHVYAAAYKRLGDAAYAKDITQDIFLQLWVRRAEIDIENLGSYLFTSVRNNVFKWLDKEQRYTPISELLLQLETAKDQSDGLLLKNELMARYEVIINTLTPGQKEIFKLRYHEDLSTSEIADRLNISRKTVQNQLRKSVVQLRSSLGSVAFLLVLLHIDK
ncbi:RNA polymerase sigma factor [Pedobacter nyackensis]|uniref:RNA polymerase sigma factor n=1 Tax=Pedobacter nyackensis TaxID=475255 RepID=UPI00292D9AF3|nr:sigma-70 family RNA polymerase sigma factor [Pedobacter nyackensis]